jgi:L-ascorbate metabolism protein UlaG (beta-lactamase superfamily)
MPECNLEFIGNATILLRMGPFTLLTDPDVLHHGERNYLPGGVFSRRRGRDAEAADLPHLDGIVLSHMHRDRFDVRARNGLDHDVPVFTTEQAGRRLHTWGFREPVPMKTWSSEKLTSGPAQLTITAVPGEHAHNLGRPLMPTVMGSVLELTQGGESLRVYLTGDTPYLPWLQEVAMHCGPLDAAVVHVGGTRVLGMLVTTDTQPGLDLVRMFSPSVTLPVQYDDYAQFSSPLPDFEQQWAAQRAPRTMRTVQRGEVVPLFE